MKALLYATKSEFLIENGRRREYAEPGVDAGSTRLSQESDSLLKDLKNLKNSYGKDALALTDCRRYIERLLSNPKVYRYLERKHAASSAHFNFGSKVSSSPDKIPEMRGGNTRVMSEFGVERCSPVT